MTKKTSLRRCLPLIELRVEDVVGTKKLPFAFLVVHLERTKAGKAARKGTFTGRIKKAKPVNYVLSAKTEHEKVCVCGCAWVSGWVVDVRSEALLWAGCELTRRSLQKMWLQDLRSNIMKVGMMCPAAVAARKRGV